MSSSKSPRQWNPSKPGNAPRIRPETWQKHRIKITALHNRPCTKKEILAVLSDEENFRPTMGQLIRQMKAWELFADQRDGIPEIEKIRAPALVGQRVAEDSCCVENDVAMNDQQATADPSDEAATWIPQDGQKLIEKEATVDQIEFADVDSTFDSAADDTSPMRADVHQEPEHTDRHRDASSTFDYNDIVDDSAQRASYISSTPPLTFAETSSMDDGSLDNEDRESEKSRLSVGRLQRRSSMSSDSPSFQRSDVAPTPMSQVNSALIDDVVVSCELLALWPGFVDPQTLTASQLCEIRGAAISLAGAGLLDDAFDLFYVDYRCWQAYNSVIPTDDAIRRIVTATVNCARTCRPGRREEIAQQMLNEVLGMLMKLGFGYSLESALLHLFLSNFREFYVLGKSQGLQNAALRMVVDCEEASFTIILPEIQDREYLFMAQALEQPALRGVSGLRGLGQPNGLSISLLRTIEQKLADPKHLLDCEDVIVAFEGLLKWCKDVIQKYRRMLDKAGGPLPATVYFRPAAAWLFYCCCACELAIIDPNIQNKLMIFQVPLCNHGSRPLMLDTPLALAVIAPSFLGSGADKTKRRISGARFSGYCIGEIEAILNSRTTRCRDLIKAYLSRINKLPVIQPELEPLGGASSVLVKEYIKAAVLARRSSSQIEDGALTRTLSMVFTSPELSRRSSPRSSIERSIRSSLNTIRSSMSLDTKQNLELKLRLRRPISLLSIRSKDTSHSQATSANFRDSDSFEGVTGMPSCGPAADLGPESKIWYRDTVMIKRIDEETNDIDMNDDI